MALVLFTDFGARDLYVGQLHAALHARAPRVPVIDALHDAPAFDTGTSAHLLAALAHGYPAGSVFVAVVDPGVGGARGAIVVEADGRSFVGPDNGLLSVVWARARRRRCRRIDWRPARLSASFHGRDLFAPVAAALAARRLPLGWLAPMRAPAVRLDPAPVARILWIDRYGNAMTGLPAAGADRARRLRVGARRLGFGRTFSDVRPGACFWTENSLGMVEVAAHRASAARRLGLRPGRAVAWAA